MPTTLACKANPEFSQLQNVGHADHVKSKNNIRTCTCFSNLHIKLLILKNKRQGEKSPYWCLTKTTKSLTQSRICFAHCQKTFFWTSTYLTRTWFCRRPSAWLWTRPCRRLRSATLLGRNLMITTTGSGFGLHQVESGYL